MDKFLASTALVVSLAVVSAHPFGSGRGVRSDLQVRKNPVVSSSAVLLKARENFEDNCTPCHGAEGKGDGPLATDLKTKPRNLTSSSELSVLTDGEIFSIITTGKDPMPAFGQKLTDEERWGLVHLVRKMSNTAAITTPRHLK